MSRLNFRITLVTIISGFIVLSPVNGQNKDKAVFTVPKPGFYINSIMKDDREVKEHLSPVRENKTFGVDLSGYHLPARVELYSNRQWHNPPCFTGKYKYVLVLFNHLFSGVRSLQDQ